MVALKPNGVNASTIRLHQGCAYTYIACYMCSLIKPPKG